MKILLFLVALSLLFGCFKKQENKIIAPEMPNYVISGNVVDADDFSLQVSNARIVMQAAYQLYDCETKVFSDTTDENGAFQFYSVCPGFYNINLFVNNILVKEQRFELKHGDTTLVTTVPKLLYADLFYTDKILTGLFLSSLDSIFFLSTWSPFNSDGEYNRVFGGTQTSSFRVIAPHPLVTEYPELTGLVQIDSLFYSFGGGLSGPKLFKISANSGKILDAIKAPHRLNDITFDENFFWGASTRQSFIKWPLEALTDIQEFTSPGNHPRGVAWDNNNIWSSDEGEFEVPRLYKHNSNMDVLLTYCPVYFSEGQTPHLLLPEYLAFSADGALWCISATPDGSKGIYKFGP
jgi:hypothetical protein